MYCVKCGVRLEENRTHCPLCQTPVWNPAVSGKEENRRTVDSGQYSDRLPKQYRNSTVPVAIILTAVSVLAALVIFLICIGIYGTLAWGGYVLLGIVQFYVMFVLPLWFRKPNPVIFLPIAHVTAAGYLLYICEKTGGSWFLSFAFPIVLATGCILTAFVVLLRYVKGGKYFIFGGFFLLLSGYLLLIELFEYVTFGIPMFQWSQYPAVVTAMIGLFLILTGIVRPLREFLERNFYI